MLKYLTQAIGANLNAENMPKIYKVDLPWPSEAYSSIILIIARIILLSWIGPSIEKRENHSIERE